MIGPADLGDRTSPGLWREARRQAFAEQTIELGIVGNGQIRSGNEGLDRLRCDRLSRHQPMYLRSISRADLQYWE